MYTTSGDKSCFHGKIQIGLECVWDESVKSERERGEERSGVSVVKISHSPCSTVQYQQLSLVSL